MLALKYNFSKKEQFKYVIEEKIIKLFYVKQNEITVNNEDEELKFIIDEIFQNQLLDEILNVNIKIESSTLVTPLYNLKKRTLHVSKSCDMKVILTNLIVNELTGGLQNLKDRELTTKEKSLIYIISQKLIKVI